MLKRIYFQGTSSKFISPNTKSVYKCEAWAYLTAQGSAIKSLHRLDRAGTKSQCVQALYVKVKYFYLTCLSCLTKIVTCT